MHVPAHRRLTVGTLLPQLLKMLKHGRAGVPLEVMGLMLGEFTDDFTVQVVDVFSMPQSGTGVSVEAVDPVYQQKVLEACGLARARTPCAPSRWRRHMRARRG